MIGQGQRDALWSGRRVAEMVQPVLGDPAATDMALRCWERERDVECLHYYHFGNLESDVKPVSPVLTEIVRRTGRSTAPDIGDVFGRGRTTTQVLSLPTLVTGLADALRRGTGRASMVRGALADLRVHVGVRQDLLGRRFRSARLVPGSDHPEPRPPALPKTRTAPSARAGAAPAVDAAATVHEVRTVLY